MSEANNRTEVPFRVSARTAKLIGLENFSNEEGAIVELVKNTYDADSKNCILVFEPKYNDVVNKDGDVIQVFNKQNSKIYVIDNGIGMTQEIISNQWMTIGTDDKLFAHTSDGGRVKTGAKGIGRFALNRLGLITHMLTVSNGVGCEWIVDWRDFDKKGASVSDVKATLITSESLNLNAELIKKFAEFPQILDAIKNTSFESGTLIEISDLNDIWEEEQLLKLYGNLEMLLPPQEQSDFAIDLFSSVHQGHFGRVNTAFFDDFDYKIEASYNKDDNKILDIKITRNELDLDALTNRYAEVFEFNAMKDAPYRLRDFENRVITSKKDIYSILSDNIDKDLVEKVGKFDFTFYFLKNTISDDKADGDVKKYPYKNIDSANRKSWLKKFGGVKIFRDDFRIRPYGENGEDWLKLGERQSQSPGGAGQRLGGYRIRPNQISGTIKISRLYNESFQDKSGREGIIENDVFDLFKNIIKEIISLFERDRNVIMYHLSELHKKRNKEAEALRKALEEAERIRQEEENNSEKEDGEQTSEADGSHHTEGEKVLAKGVQILTEEIDKKDDEIRLLRSLASVGLIISSFAHEVKSLRSRLIPRTSHLLDVLRNHLNESNLSLIDKDDNPFYMIRLMQDEDIKLKHWLDYSLTTLKRDKRERTNLNFSNYFDTFKSTWSKALAQRSIKINVSGDEGCIMRAFEVDMDSIFNNLLSNSINALRGYKEEGKEISITWQKIDENIEVIFSDNGRGLDKQYQENPDKIFELNESSKTDKRGNVIGTGLGLYIVRSIIDEYNNSSISIIKMDEGLTLKLTFRTR